MATNLNSISSLTAGLTSFSNLILINPQKNVGYYEQAAPVPPGEVQTPQDVTGWLFDYEGENSIALESDITQHFVEDNTARTDQIAIRPIMVSVQGFVGELSDVLRAADGISTDLTSLGTLLQSKLQTLSAYTPELSTAALVAINEAVLGYQVAANAVNTVKSLAGLGGKADAGSPGDIQYTTMTKQQKAFARLYSAFQSKSLFTIQTPWAIFRNMAIKSLRAIQSPETRMITDFEIQFQKIQYIELLVEPQVGQGRAGVAGAPVINGGSYIPAKSKTTFSEALKYTEAPSSAGVA